MKSWLRRFSRAIVVTSVTIQAASVFFWYGLEDRQVFVSGHSTFVVGLRFVNIVAFALRTRDKWGLSNPFTHTAQMTMPDFFPFLLMGEGTLPRTKVALLIAAWTVLVVVLLGLILLITTQAREAEKTSLSSVSGAERIR